MRLAFTSCTCSIVWQTGVPIPGRVSDLYETKSGGRRLFVVWIPIILIAKAARLYRLKQLPDEYQELLQWYE